MADCEEFYDDNLDEIIISFIPSEMVTKISKGVHPALNFIRNEEPEIEEKASSSATIGKIQLLKPREDTLTACFEFWKAALKSVQEDEIYKIGPESIINKRKSTIDRFFKVLSEENLPCFGEILLKLYSVLKQIENSSFLSDGKQKLWKNFYACLSSDDYKFHWAPLLDIAVVDNFDLLCFKLSDKLMEILVADNNLLNNDTMVTNDIDVSKMDEREQNAVKYVAGFIPFVLLKRYQGSINESAKKYSTVLSSWCTRENDSKSFIFKDKWINMVDRGGLVNVNDNCFLFFRAVEYCVKGVFNVEYLKKYNGENLKSVILETVFKSTQVLNCWDVAVGEIEMTPEEKENLMKIVAQYWINIRGRAFIRAWVDELRGYNKDVSKKGEHSLRKQLNTSNRK